MNLLLDVGRWLYTSPKVEAYTQVPNLNQGSLLFRLELTVSQSR